MNAYSSLLSVGVALILAPITNGGTLTTLHSFSALRAVGDRSFNTDGAGPNGIISSGNVLYGITGGGGGGGQGTVFKANTDGTGFTNLHNFSNLQDVVNATNEDGAGPSALILSGNTLYGATGYGGAAGYGTVFALNTDGTDFQTLFNFNQQNIHGAISLVLSGNTLYGTTASGGGWGFGMVFALSTDGASFTDLYDFSNTGDGAGPRGPLLLSSNTLYGTTVDGLNTLSGGTVFAVNIDGSGFTTLYEFTPPSPYSYGTNADGAWPNGGLVLLGDTLYGSTEGGGSGSSFPQGFGTLFAVKADGSHFSNLHYFGYGNDGRLPWFGLLSSSNALYGTTSTGNNIDDTGVIGGTVFTLNSDGSGFTTLHDFSALQGPSGTTGTNGDGARPMICTLSGNTFYGVTALGGSGGNGTLFSLSTGPVALPQLTLTAFAPNVILTWPGSNPGFTLQSATNLGPAAVWAPVSSGPVLVNGNYTVTNPISVTQQFFRLTR